jgi:hypothetical protein
MRIRRSLLKETVTVETYAAPAGLGPVLAASVTVYANVDNTRRLVRDAQGAEVISDLALYVHPDDVATFTPESRVTYSGRTSSVLTVNPQVIRGHAALVKVVCG